MAFNVFFNIVENDLRLYNKSIPWRCDKCNDTPKLLMKISVDYDTLVLCKKCLASTKKMITDKEKELNNDSKSDL
jgi:glutaredoxin